MKHKKGSFTTIPNMMVLKGRNPILQVIYMWLCFHVDKKGVCFPSQLTIANECGVSLSSINRHIKELEHIRLIKRYVRIIEGSKERNTTIYSLLGTVTETVGTVTETVGTVTETVGVLSQRQGGTVTETEITKSNELNPIELEKKKEKKSKFGEFENVLLSEKEIYKLKERFGNNYEDKIQNVSESFKMHGYEYKSHYAVILNWNRKDKKELTHQKEPNIIRTPLGNIDLNNLSDKQKAFHVSKNAEKEKEEQECKEILKKAHRKSS